MPSTRELAVSAGLRANRIISGRPVTYSRGASSLTISRAVKKTLQHTTVDSGGASIVREAVWRISAAELSILFPPEVNDTITDESGGVYRIECPGDSQLHWEYTDVGATEVSIYSRLNGFAEVALQGTIDLTGNDVLVG